MADENFVTASIIAERIAHVRKQISDICHRYNRDVSAVRLIAVSKTKPVEAVRAAIDAGQIDFGENQVQDALTKIPYIDKQNLIWHFIGPLQSNKSKQVASNFDWWHTLNRVDIAERVSAQAAKTGRKIDTLIQVNVTNDSAKSGVSIDALTPLIEALHQVSLNGIKLRGLMTIGPQAGSELQLRECFSTLRRLLIQNREQFNLADFDQLSMGMTGDMEHAIAEGATMVRIGSSIFGSR